MRNTCLTLVDKRLINHSAYPTSPVPSLRYSPQPHSTKVRKDSLFNHEVLCEARTRKAKVKGSCLQSFSEEGTRTPRAGQTTSVAFTPLEVE
jgi:hypothetical protein